MSQIHFWYEKESDNHNDVNIIAVSCSNCVEKTGLYMDNMDTKYKYIVSVYVLNTLLPHAGMSWIVEAYE